MKKLSILSGLLLTCTALFCQVGIGTLTPNAKSVLELSSSSKGLLLPRMTSADRTNMPLASADAGMMVYQTTAPKGPYSWDGTNWIFATTVDPGIASGNTLRWDGVKWIPVSNLYNGGGSIGINMNGVAPNYQLHLHSTGPSFTRLQITSAATSATTADGLVLGVGNTLNPGVAHLIQQENKALWFGTNAIERVRIDSAGNVGVNTMSPSATLDVSGSFKLGASGTILQGIIRMDYEIDLPAMVPNSEWIAPIPCANTLENGVVWVSPSGNMDHIIIGHSRVASPGNLEIKFMNMSSMPSNDPGPVTLHILVIQ